MTSQEFAYWLQGFAELNAAAPNDKQWAMIKEHLQLCFIKLTSEPDVVRWDVLMNTPEAAAKLWQDLRSECSIVTHGAAQTYC